MQHFESLTGHINCMLLVGILRLNKRAEWQREEKTY